jgi:hypothetical protein
LGRLRRLVVQTPRLRNVGTLYQALGALHAKLVSLYTFRYLFFSYVFFIYINSNIIIAQPSVENVTEKDYKILGGLPNRVKREIAKAQRKLERFASPPSDGAKEEYKKSYIPLNIPIDVIEEFLRRFMLAVDQNSLASILASDWTALKVVLSTGTVTVSKYPTMISAIVCSGRLDVLQCIAQHCHDLSEKQAVLLLIYTMAASETALSSLSVTGDDFRIEWGSLKKGSSTFEETDKKLKKRKITSDEVITKSFDNTIVLDMVRSMLIALLRRRDTYSQVLLAESIRSGLSGGTAALVLRVISSMLKKISSGQFDFASTTRAELLRDEQIRRAVTWAEAILDAHFSSFSLQLSVAMARDAEETVATNGSYDNHFQRAVLNAAEVLASLETSKDEIEEVIGTWEQVLAMNYVKHLKDKRGRLVSTGPPVGVYQLEDLPLTFL